MAVCKQEFGRLSAEEVFVRRVAKSVPDDADLGIMHHPRLSMVLTGEMARLYRAGLWLLPLGTSREPLLKFRTGSGAATKRHPLSLVLQKMVGAGSSNYVIRLRDMLVVDVDTDTPEARDYVRNRFGDSAVQVKSPRGVHHYYKFKGKAPPAVRLPNIAIDFKAGEQQLIAGPFAERADGGQYLPLVGKLEAIEALPPFIDRLPPKGAALKTASRNEQRINVGLRNKALYSKAISFVSCSDTKEQLFDDLCRYRDISFEDPASVPDSEVEKVADWAFQKYQQGNVFSGRRSSVLIPRTSIDILAARGHGLAHLLYSIIMSELGHKAGLEFAIVPDALRKSGKLKAGRRQIYDAIQVLLDEKLIEIAFLSEKPKVPHRYRLIGIEKEERGFSNYIDTLKGHKGFIVHNGGRVD